MLMVEWAAVARAEDALLLDQVVRLGVQTAYERVAHFLLEIQERLALVGQADDQHFPLPLTQEVLAGALGLSIVHVNRTLRLLREENIAIVDRHVVMIFDMARLRQLAQRHDGGVAELTTHYLSGESTSTEERA